MMRLATSFLQNPIAHRGLHDISQRRPENSLAAFDAAVAQNYGIELDVQMSADGLAMVFHDYGLGRLTHETGAVQRRAAVALQDIELRGSSEKIPTLAQVLKLVNDRVPVLVEIKDQDGALGPNTGELEASIAKDLFDYKGDIAVMSFNPHSVAWMKKLLPATPRGLVTGAFSRKNLPLIPEATRRNLRKIPDFDRVGACFISHNVIDLERPRVSEIRALGAPVLCWTVRDEADEKTARQFADNITFEGYLARHISA